MYDQEKAPIFTGDSLYVVLTDEILVFYRQVRFKQRD